MSGARRVLAWFPPLVVGMTLAAAVEISTALLLYSGPGLLRALTLILSVEAGAAALGLWVAAGVERSRVIEAIRRRWLFALVMFSAAAVTSGVWAVVGGFSGSRLGQGLGLAVLGGLPLYGAGALAGLLGRPQAGLASSSSAPWPGPGVMVVLGVGLGFLLTGGLLTVGLPPTSVFLGCIVALSAAALVHAGLLRPGPTVRTVEERDTVVGLVQVEDRVSPAGEEGVRLLRVAGRIRAVEDRDGGPALPDEARVLRIAAEWLPGTGRVLLLGMGGGTLARKVAELAPEVRVDAVAESAEVFSLVRKHFSAPGRDAGRRIRIREGDPRVLTERESGSYDLVLVDASAVARGAPVPRLSDLEVRRLRDVLVEGGRLVVFRLPGRDAAPEALDALLAAVRARLPDTELRPEARTDRAEVLAELEVDSPPSGLLVATREGGGEMPERSGRETDEDA